MPKGLQPQAPVLRQEPVPRPGPALRQEPVPRPGPVLRQEPVPRPDPVLPESPSILPEDRLQPENSSILKKTGRLPLDISPDFLQIKGKQSIFLGYLRKILK